VLELSYDELFALTHFQFLQLVHGWEERDKRSLIERAEIITTLINVNRWDENTKAVTIADVLPWYKEYSGDGDKSDYINEIPEQIDETIPQAERMAIKLLNSKGIEEIDRESDEWKENFEIATRILDMTKGVDGDVVMYQGVGIKKADPKIWGDKFPDW